MGLKEMFNVRSPFFAPKGRRVAVCAIASGWALFELANGNVFWAAVTAAAAAWCIYEFFVVFDPEHYKDRDDG